MGLFKRLSDSVWFYVSPQKTDVKTNNALPTPNTTEPLPNKLPAAVKRRPSFYDLAKDAKSMSPDERIGNWKIRSPVSTPAATTAGIKRKKSLLESPSFGRKNKMSRMDIDDEGTPAVDEMFEDEYEEFAEGYSVRISSSPQVGRHDSPTLDDYEEDETMSVENSLLVVENEATPKRKLVNLPEEHSMRHISDDQLRSEGWDDDYITLIQKVAMRGYEPVLPAYVKFEYRFLPDGLFEQGDDAFISSVRQEHFKASKALEQLIELGGRVRDRMYMEGVISPENQVKRQINAYLRWAIEDAGLDNRTLIPILAMEVQPAGTEAAKLRANATAKCRRLAARYREALRVKRSIEVSPASDGTIISYPLPTFYAVIASHAIVAIMAYRPEVDEVGVTPMAFFDFKETNYDVWNSLALAILVCHVRNVQMRIAEETGLGERQSVYSEDEMEHVDPDL